jgi:fructokinase
MNHGIVCYGEILWDLLPSGPQPGGAPMNVAYQLHRLGKGPAMISRIGKDERGDELMKVLQNKGLNTKYIQIDEAVPTGIVKATQTLFPLPHGTTSLQTTPRRHW